ncbi:MAG: DUF4397 domain-containing protein [Chloroflexi bacterium]|nr:DUF4397 domain-containing protein [Chloroflexota bacterium]
MNRLKWMVAGLLVVTVVVGLAGPMVGGEEAQAQVGTSRVRFLHAVPGAPNVDIYLDGMMIAADIAFATATPHLNVEAGTHQIDVRMAGSNPSSAALMTVEEVPLDPTLAFMVVVQGTPDALDAALYEDFLDEIAPGQARVAAINTIADAPPLDMITASGAPLLQGIAYGEQFSTINISTGVQDLLFLTAGGSTDNPVAEVGEVALHSGMLYTFVAIGTLEGQFVASTLVLVSPVNGPRETDFVRVQLAHASPDVPAVDVYANDVLLAPALDFGQVTGHIPLAVGDYTLAVRAAGADPADDPVLSTDVTLDLSAAAVTVVALGELGAESLRLEIFPNDLNELTPGMARVVVVNTVPGSAATATLVDPAATLLAADVNAGTQGDAVDFAPGGYMLTVNVAGIENPVDVLVPMQSYAGGMFYTALVYGGGAEGKPLDVSVMGTELAVTAESLPGVSAEMVAAPEVGDEPADAAPADVPADDMTAETEDMEATPEPSEPVATEEAPAPAESEVVADETAVDEPAADLAPTEAPPPPATEEVAPPPADSEVVADVPAVDEPAEDAPPADAPVEETEPAPLVAPPDEEPQALVTPQPRPIAFVQLNPGANLHCRELPSPDARSLGLIPSGATLTVVGRTGTPLVPETGNATPEPTPVVEAVEELWLSVQWEPEGGGYLRCWVSAEFLRVEYRGQLLDQLDELWELPEEPFNRPGEVVGADIEPPTPVFDAVIATVELEPGVSLQLRRFPETDAEVLDRVPAQAQLEVLGYVEAPGEGLVGQPVDPNWLRVRYRKENGAATIGWVSAQYVSLSQLGREVELTELVLLDSDDPEAGFFEDPGTQPLIPVEQQAIIGQVNLNPGANLNLRDRPSPDALVVIGIPSGQTMEINGRNGDGTWVQVTYEADTGDLDGWVATQYLIITRGGQPFDVAQLPHLWDDEDVLD